LLRALLLAMAPVALAHGDLHGQIEALDAQVQREPTNVGLILRRAELHHMHGEPAEAERDYDFAESIAPGHFGIDLGRGKLWLDTGRLEPARHALDRALAREPAHVEALVTRARVLARLGDAAAAAADFQRAIDHAARPEPEYYLEAAQALWDAGDARRVAALEVLEAGLARLGPLPTLGLAAVDLEMRLGRPDAALARLDRLRTGATRQETWLERRGDVQQAAGRADLAAREYDAALAAIEALPARLRSTRAVQDLEKRVQGKLESIRRR